MTRLLLKSDVNELWHLILATLNLLIDQLMFQVQGVQ